MSKISNVLTMLELLNSGKKYSIKELADILEVSERMIRLYKEDLEKAGIYIDTIMGPYGGYVLNQTIRLPSRKFKKADCCLLDKYIVSEKDQNQKEKLINLKDKIRGIYKGSKAEEQELNLKDATLSKYNLLTRARVFVVVNKPETILQMIENGVKLKEVNIGNMGMKEGRETVKKSVYCTPAEKEKILSIEEKGIPVYAQMIPNDEKKKFRDFIN